MDSETASLRREQFSEKKNTENQSSFDKESLVKTNSQRLKNTLRRLTHIAPQGDASSVPEDENEFIKAIEVGDFPTVQRVLNENPEFNVNCTDFLGRTPLRLAVEGEHLEVS